MKYKPKSYVMPTLYLLFLFVITAGIYFTQKTFNVNEKKEFDNITFVSSSIFNRSVPIINVPEVIIKPYTDENILISKYYYNKQASEEDKVKAVVYYEGTYMPNTGIDYKNEKEFDVISVYDGTVIDIENNEILGKSVKIRHNGEIISVYQGLGEIDVKEGDVVFTGQKIGTSGTNKINQNNGNNLHFEIYKNGETIDPLTCIDKKLSDI